MHLRAPHNLPEIEVGRIEKIAGFQLERIQQNIESVLHYLANTWLSSDSSTPLMPDSQPSGHLSYYYVLTTIWYVKRNFPEKHYPQWKWDWKKSLAESKEDCLMFKSGRLPSDNWSFVESEGEQVPFLQWYHYGSMLALHQQGILRWECSGLDEKVSTMAKAAKTFAAAKLSSRRPYCTDDEIIDRLSFLSDELGLQPRQRGQIGAVAAASIKRVKRRDNTRFLNPGWLQPGSKETTSGPWEVHALCHHSRLMALSLEEKDNQDWRAKEHTKEEIESYKQRIYSFRNAEGTLISCWERAHAKAREGWLRSEATAVLASTLLNINRKYLKNGLHDYSTDQAPGKAHPPEQAQAGQPQDTQGLPKLTPATAMSSENPQAGQHQNTQNLTKPEPGNGLYTKATKPARGFQSQATHDLTKHVDLVQGNLLLEMKYMESIMKDQLNIFERFTGESGRLPPINWVAFSPPRRYHPASFFDSLEDTPENYAVDCLNSASIPTSIIGKITAPQDLKDEFGEGHESGFNWVYLCKHLESLNMVDIPVIQSNDKTSGFSQEIEFYEYINSTPKQKFVKPREKDPRWRLYDSVRRKSLRLRILLM